MNEVKQMLAALMEIILKFVMLRRNIAIRFGFTLVYMAAWGIANVAILFLTLFQFAWLFISTEQSEAIVGLSHKITVYIYKVLRFISLNEEARPYPFGPMPEEIEPAEEVDLSVELPEEPAAKTASPVNDTVTPAPSVQKTGDASEEDIKEAAIILDYKEEKKEQQ